MALGRPFVSEETNSNTLRGGEWVTERCGTGRAIEYGEHKKLRVVKKNLLILKYMKIYDDFVCDD